MSIQFFDTERSYLQLQPLTYTRPAASLRVGILTIAEKWEHSLSSESNKSGYYCREYLQDKYKPLSGDEDVLWVRGNVLPDPELIGKVEALVSGELLLHENELLAARAPANSNPSVLITGNKKKQFEGSVKAIHRTWDIFSLNGEEIRSDFLLITRGRKSHSLGDPHSIVYGDQLFIEEGASIRAAVINSESGPVFIGKDAVIHEGAIIKGPFALGEGAHVNMGAKIKGDSTIGPFCKVGGEISNSVFQGFSNKGHDGFLGNSVIGEWCNLGADTNNSNLKNNYDLVKMWDFVTKRFISTGLQFCGLIMGDHSKCGINTMFNTGTTVGVSANIYGDGFPRNHIASFAWGGASGFTTYKLSKACETAALVMERRKQSFTEADKKIMEAIFLQTSGDRIWEKASAS